MELSDFLIEWNNEATYVVAHTSGSTGKPKEIRLPKDDMRASARATNQFFGIGTDAVLGIPLDFGYIAAKMMVVRSLEAGCELVPMAVSNHININRKYTLLSVVPSQTAALAAHPEWSRLVENLLVGGGPLSTASEQALIDAGYRGYCSYGMTETCSHVALRTFGEDTYQAMPRIKFSVDDRNCLQILAQDFSFGMLATNDVVELLGPTSFRWLGRADNAIISGGVKIHPEQVEALYAPFLNCQFYVKGEADEKWGQALVLVIEGDGSDRDIMAILRSHVSDHKLLPKRIQWIKALPKAQNGKIRRV